MGTPVSNNFDVSSPKHIDSRKGRFTSGVWRPFTSTTEANSSISSFYRYNGLIVYIGTPTSYQEYWYYGGIADNDLIAKSAGSNVLVDTINPWSNTYTNTRLIGASQEISVNYSGMNIYPSFDPSTGTLDNSTDGGFAQDGIITIVYGSGSVGSGGSSSAPILQWNTKSTTTTLLSTQYNIEADATSGNITLTLPSSCLQDIRIKRIDSSINTLTITGNIDGVSGQTIQLGAASVDAPGEAYTFSYSTNRTTYNLL